jgi:REP element-mobilizing transposase RayT
MPKGLVRYQQSGCFHFLTFSCYRRQPLLDNETAYGILERELEAVHQRYGFVVAGYVLMPEHVHLLVGEPRCSSLSVALQVLKQQTSRKAVTIHAAQEDLRGIDPTRGATQYNMRTPKQYTAMGDRAPSWAKGMVVHTRSGPFPLWKGPQYILTYGQPLKKEESGQ